MSHTTPATTGYADSTREVLARDVTILAGVLLTSLSVFLQIIERIWEFANDKVLVSQPSTTYAFGVTTCGWSHVVLRLVVLGPGLDVLFAHERS